ncbi:double-strand break repair protein AddB [Thalassococcus sp. S3]|nr:double-strand break repair protein AddB [Thalassococcus sp. S3]
MFEPSKTPRVFALPPGVDFPASLVHGLSERMQGMPPTALAQVELIVNTRRMARRLREIFDDGPARLLPRIKLLNEVGEIEDRIALPNPVSPLRRRLEIAQLVDRLLQRQPDLAPRASLYDLADGLAELLDEMQGEGVLPQAISDLDVTDLSGHWSRAQTFIGIVQAFFDNEEAGLDGQSHLRRLTEHLVDRWDREPPQHPVIVAGSTGSRGTTMMLMEAVSRLPQGALVLPGFDFDLPSSIWSELADPMVSEDHPQYRFRALMVNLGIKAAEIAKWRDDQPSAPARNRVVSLALRPAPVTDAWLDEGPDLPKLEPAFEQVTWVEAPSPRDEALAIALRLREAAETGQTAALITPDRMLTRQVTAALDRWDLLPDDSAGQPLQLAPPGRFLRHVAGLFSRQLTSEMLLTILKHPLCHDGADRNEHLLLTRDFELHVRSKGIPFPEPEPLAAWAEAHNNPIAARWAKWVTDAFCDRIVDGEKPLTRWVAHLRNVAEVIARGSGDAPDLTLWDKNAGIKALSVLDALEQEADHGGQMEARVFADLLGALLSREEVRDRDAPHPGIMIWGTLEARVQGADLLILGGLNEGTWPEAAKPDPWLNRQMRKDAGLLLPERRIGLSAHDFQQAIAAREVWLTRAIRSDDAQSVPSRWINRLSNLLGGLPALKGPETLAAMKARGDTWLSWAATLEEAPLTAPAPRPSPRPPVTARPRKISVTDVKRLIRDPYAIYAKHVLRLRRLDPLVQAPGPLLRGVVVHEVLEAFIRATLEDRTRLSRDHFLALADTQLRSRVPWPTARVMWQARLGRIADIFLQAEIERQTEARPFAFERRGRVAVSDPAFTLEGVADRIDMDASGRLRIYDYKTGTPPSKNEQKYFDKQLLLEAAMAEKGGFFDLDPTPVSRAVYLGLGPGAAESAAPLADEPAEKVWAQFIGLIGAYFEPNQGYTSRLKMQKDTDIGDYDQLARFGEWDLTDQPVPVDLA